MELFDLEQSLRSVASAGSVLSCQELTGIQAGLQLLKTKEKFPGIYFWGKVLGQKLDYYVAYGLRDTEFEFPGKDFFYAGEDFEFKPLPRITEESANRIIDVISEKERPFTGNPQELLEPPEEGQEQEEEEENAPPKPPSLTEADRLAQVVQEIDFDTAVVPKGAHSLNEAHVVVPSSDFHGLGLFFRCPDMAVHVSSERFGGLVSSLSEQLCYLEAQVQDCKATVESSSNCRREPTSETESYPLRVARIRLRHAIRDVKRAIALVELPRNATCERVNTGGSGYWDASLFLEEDKDDEPLLSRDSFDSYRARTLMQEKLMWEESERRQDFNFFQDLLIARDGGFSEVNLLWKPRRYLTAAFKSIVVVLNVLTILVWDVMVLQKVHRGEGTRPFLITSHLLGAFLHPFNASIPLDGCSLICYIELSILAWLIASGFWQLVQAVAASDDEWLRWRCMQVLFWQAVPEISTYSAMRLLHFTSPVVIVSDLIKFVNYSKTRWKGKPHLLAGKWLQFVSFRLVCLVLGFDAYLLKIHGIEVAFRAGDHSSNIQHLVKLFVFLHQVMSIVQLDLFVKRRLFIFIFGGEDGIMNTTEKARRSVWNTMLTRAIWKEHPGCRFCALMMTFSDYDFQRLVLNERSNDNAILAAMKVDSSDEATDSLSDEGLAGSTSTSGE